MPKITSFDRAVAKALHAEFAAALKAPGPLADLAAKYGLVLTHERAVFDGASMTFKVKMAVPAAEAPVPSHAVTIAAMQGFDVRGASKDGKFKVTDYTRGKKPWKMVLADGSDPGRYWSAPDGFMRLNFPAWTEASPVKATEAFDLIKGAEVAPPSFKAKH